MFRIVLYKGRLFSYFCQVGRKHEDTLLSVLPFQSSCNQLLYCTQMIYQLKRQSRIKGRIEFTTKQCQHTCYCLQAHTTLNKTDEMTCRHWTLHYFMFYCHKISPCICDCCPCGLCQGFEPFTFLNHFYHSLLCFMFALNIITQL